MPSLLVSILIPSYNHALYFRECLASILTQTYHDWELIVVDDGSTDDSVSIAKEAARSESRIQVHVNPSNLGTYGTEQAALNRANGDYIAVMNSDDRWSPSKLARQVMALESDPNASFCYALGDAIDSSGKPLDEDIHANWPRTDPQEPLPFLLSDNRILASGTLFRKKSLRFDASCRYSGDWVALLEQSRFGHARLIAEPMTFWRQHATNSFRRSIPQTFEEIRVRTAIHRVGERWQTRAISKELVRRGLGQNAMHLVPLLVYVGQFGLAKEIAAFAVRHHANKVAALKRTTLLALGADRSRTHFWSVEDLGLLEGKQKELEERFRTMPPLEFKL